MANRHIYAGPGTGKSTEIVAVLRRAIAEGTPATRILALTLTRASAQDLRNALLDEGPALAGVEVSTLHSYAMGLLLRNQVLEADERSPRILMEYEWLCLLADLQGDFGNLDDRRKLLKALAAGWARDGVEQVGWAVEPADADFERELDSWLRRHRGMLMDEVVPKALVFVRDNPASDELGRFDLVLVDEYQDLNAADQHLIQMLRGEADATVVGDDDQSIYSFRYANPDGLRRYSEQHAESQAERRSICYRCPRRVIEVATSVLRHNRPLDEWTLAPRDGAIDGHVYRVQWPSYSAEIEGVAEVIKQYHENLGVDRKDILVLCPWRWMGYEIRDKLGQAPDGSTYAHTYFSEEVVDRRAPALQFAILNLVANPDDPVAWRAALAGTAGDRRASAYRRLCERAVAEGKLPLTLLDELARGIAPDAHRFRALIGEYDSIKQKLEVISPLTGADFVEAWLPEGDQQLGELRDFARPYLENLQFPAAAFEAMRRSLTEPDPPPDVPAVRIMSLHRSKGLSAKIVIIAGAVSGLLPRRWDPKKTVLTEEEYRREQRRLFYVGLTRAKHTVLVTSSLHWGTGRLSQAGAAPRGSRGPQRFQAVASPFISELGPSAVSLPPSRVGDLEL